MTGRYASAFGGLAAACLVWASVQGAVAQEFPAEPITIIVPVAAGGGTDAIARVVAQAMSERLPQPVVVKNVPGASGMVANTELLGGRKDGYTVLWGSSNLTLLPQVRKLEYTVGDDLVPVAMLFDGGNLLVVNSQLPIKSVEDLIAYGKANPDKLSYGTAGIGTITHLGMAGLMNMAGITALHVPYDGSAEYGAATAGGVVSMSFMNPEAAMGLVDLGKVRAIAASGLKRIPLLPEIPTVSESGVPGFSYDNWMGIFVAKGVPNDVILKLNGAFNEAIQDQKVLDFVKPQGKSIRAGTPEDFAKLVQQDLLDKAKAAEAAGLKAE